MEESATAARTALGVLPAGLEAYHCAYEDVIERIEGHIADQVEVASRFSRGYVHLSMLELKDTMVVAVRQTGFDFENPFLVEDLVASCAGLVTIDDNCLTVRLVNYTTQQYFEKTHTHKLPSKWQSR
ncbi:hypothetical protein QBC33DRAFT_564061 [Phialemonium atrogriseum]|uniref:Uncharacterized protein n=1 Tax=Phialemonium atrogriseum TaxID=1093897 RepID=A0AAJ0BRM7_9PEZI|nr:uncharacterized protein QBC33DRAFT_564061 [Phialemonium atrogriseum]KAK1762138.1 hypothetical protein QBC33DRAFT_564061 [Phialemonium atrogriseum]